VSSLWSQYIVDVKAKLDIVDVVGGYITLDRKGHVHKARCPFHHEKDPSFVVFSDSQRWQCFGACNSGGDVFDFLMRIESWDFNTALKELGRRAGLEPPERDQESEARYRARRQYEDELEVVASFFRLGIFGNNPGREYARSRGWSDETINTCLLGYARKDGLGALKGYLKDRGVKLNSRAGLVAQKVQGYAYHKGGALVYIHRENGRTVYLSARAIQPDIEHHETKYNPPINVVSDDGRTVLRPMAGPKQPFIVGKPLNRAESVIIIEGQACAITLVEEWQAVDTAVAIAGADINDDALIEDLQRVRDLYLALDNDATGLERRRSLADRLGALVRVVTWPTRDANDLLQVMRGLREFEGFVQPDDLSGECSYISYLLENSPTWLDMRLDEYQLLADMQKRAVEAEEIAELYGDLSRPIRLQVKDQVCDALGIGRQEFNRLVKMVLERRLSKEPYGTRWGVICRQNGIDDDGTPNWVPLAPFDARVIEEITHDNGRDREIHFSIAGRHRDGYQFQTITINAMDYSNMGWLTGLWGASAYPFEASPHHLRRAILELSEPARKTMYTHIGWRDVGGEKVYLYHGGAVGSNGADVDVQLDDSLLRGYTLPAYPEDLPGAMEASLRFLELTDMRITGPLWATMYLSPVSEIVTPDFILFVYGKTGAMKSTITALALNHYGNNWSYNRMPGSWNDTVTSLEIKAFLLKDAPFVIDDYARDVQIAREHDKKAAVMFRQWGNRTGKARRQSNLKARPDFPPRGVIISSGEQLPSGQSIIGRLFPIEVRTSDIAGDEQARARLSACQAESDRYGHAMAGYLLWVREHWDDLRQNLPSEWESLRDRDEINDLGHRRIPSALSTLYVGFDLAMKFYLSQGIITEDRAADLRREYWNALMQDAVDHKILVEEEDPIDRFVRIMRNLFVQGRVWVKGAGDIADTDHEYPSEMLGWGDEDWIYLLGEATLSYIQRYCRQAGDPFPLNRNAFYKGLVDKGLAIPGTRFNTIQYREGDNKVDGVLKLNRAAFELEAKKRQTIDQNGDPPSVEF